VRRDGEPLGVKVELKNLNSFAHVVAALKHEIRRQIEGLESGDPARKPVQETRLFDVAAGVTRTMRLKEEAHDYRYFPDPDLPPFTVARALLERLATSLPELPAARRERYASSLGLSEYDAAQMTASRATADFFEATVRRGAGPKEAANWIGNEVAALFSEPGSGATSIDEIAFKPFDLAELIELAASGRTNRAGARAILRAMAKTPKGPRELLRELGLEQVEDAAQLERWCREALAGREKAVEEFRAGNEKALGALIGPVMKLSGGKANPQSVRDTLARLIRG
jgi:aspartyl-tRNA(Asn)/glutamyl-tRNA(Gln) amidotransferase subunit B